MSRYASLFNRLTLFLDTDPQLPSPRSQVTSWNCGGRAPFTAELRCVTENGARVEVSTRAALSCVPDKPGRSNKSAQHEIPVAGDTGAGQHHKRHVQGIAQRR